jgi:Phage Mu protein F like protein
VIGRGDRQAALAAQLAAVAAAHKELDAALRDAMGAYLELVAAGVLGSGPHGQHGPVDMDAWPPAARWSDLVAAKVTPVVLAAWTAAYRRAWPGHEPDPEARAAYGAALSERVGSGAFPRYAQAQVRSEIAASRAAGESGKALRTRLALLLTLGAPGRAGRAALLAIAARAAKGKPKPSDAKRRGKVLKKVAAGFGAWLSVARGTAATESSTAINGGTMAAGGDYTDAGGGVLLKEWVAVEDNRTRPAHTEADGQTVGSDEPFTVDDEAMMYPGDPAGSSGNTANCRCVLLLSLGDASEDEDGGDQDEGDDEMDDVGDVGLVGGALAGGGGKGKGGKGKKGRKDRGSGRNGHRLGPSGTGGVKRGKIRKHRSGRVKAARRSPRAGDAKKKIKMKPPPKAVPLKQAPAARPSANGPGWTAPFAAPSEPVRWGALGD